jgi:hypothetical protein
MMNVVGDRDETLLAFSFPLPDDFPKHFIDFSLHSKEKKKFDGKQCYDSGRKSMKKNKIFRHGESF